MTWTVTDVRLGPVTVMYPPQAAALSYSDGGERHEQPVGRRRRVGAVGQALEHVVGGDAGDGPGRAVSADSDSADVVQAACPPVSWPRPTITGERDRGQPGPGHPEPEQRQPTATAVAARPAGTAELVRTAVAAVIPVSAEVTVTVAVSRVVAILAEITALAVNHDRIVRSGASAPVAIHGYWPPNPSLPSWTRARATWHAQHRGSSKQPGKGQEQPP